MTYNDLLAELKESIYSIRNEIEKRHIKIRIPTKTSNYRDIVELVKNPNFDVVEDFPHVLGYLLDLNNTVLENKVTAEELSDLLTIIYNNQVIKNTLDKSLYLNGLIMLLTSSKEGFNHVLKSEGV